VILGITTAVHPLINKQGFYVLDGENRLFTMPFEQGDETEEGGEEGVDVNTEGGATATTEGVTTTSATDYTTSGSSCASVYSTLAGESGTARSLNGHDIIGTAIDSVMVGTTRLTLRTKKTHANVRSYAMLN
jgi:hypothetical protein